MAGPRTTLLFLVYPRAQPAVGDADLTSPRCSLSLSSFPPFSCSPALSFVPSSLPRRVSSFIWSRVAQRVERLRGLSIINVMFPNGSLTLSRFHEPIYGSRRNICRGLGNHIWAWPPWTCALCTWCTMSASTTENQFFFCSFVRLVFLDETS